MRLGCNWRQFDSVDDIDEAAEYLSTYNVGTIGAPDDLADWSVSAARSFGTAVRDRGLTIGEAGYWENLMTSNERIRQQRIAEVRDLLQKADEMRVDCVVTLVGSMGDGAAGKPHPDNYGDVANERARKTVQQILDGIHLNHTTFALEPWFNSFFHRAPNVRQFLDSIDDDRLGVHMDAMNMLCVGTVYRSTEAIDEMFALLGDDVAAVHAKDIRMEADEPVVALRECPPGKGAMNYDHYLTALDRLDDDIPVFTEHWTEDAIYEETLQFLSNRASALDVTVVRAY